MSPCFSIFKVVSSLFFSLVFDIAALFYVFAKWGWDIIWNENSFFLYKNKGIKKHFLTWNLMRELKAKNTA